MRVPLISVLAISLATTGCDRSDPPSDQLKDAVETAVGQQDAEAPPKPKAGSYAPRNECGDVEGASAFLGQLRKAVDARDAEALSALTAEDVLLDFGGGSGREVLRERLADKDLKLWDELDLMMKLGCASSLESDGITIPWYFAQDMGNADPYGTSIALGSKVPVFTGKGGDAVLRHLDWELVEMASYTEIRAEEQQPGGRQKVNLPDGQSGFVDPDRVRSLIGYRLLAEPTRRGWRIRVFVAGD